MTAICIITPDGVSISPRTVKQADALYRAGYDVRVVFSQGNIEHVRRGDETVLAKSRWAWDSVKWSKDRTDERRLHDISRWRHFFLKKAPSWLPAPLWAAEAAEARVFPELLRLASKQPADLFIGHYPAGLAIAARCAARRNAAYGYDFEDLYTHDLPDTPDGRRKASRIARIEGRYVRGSSLTTAASEPMAARIAEIYGIKPPLAVYNTFELKTSQTDGRRIDRTRSGTLSVYWFSQTVGENRGLEDAIRAVETLGGKAELHIRGAHCGQIKQRLLNLVSSAARAWIFFHDPVAPGDLVSRAAEHDVGLAGEQPVNENKNLTVSNKLFIYMLAGVAIAATDVAGQSRVMSTCPDAGFVYRPGDAQELAGRLAAYISQPDLLAAARRASLDAAKARWNWERDSQVLLDGVAAATRGRTR